MKPDAKKYKIVIAFLLVLLLIGYVVSQRDVFFESLMQINCFWAILGLCFHYANYYFRSLRLVRLTKNGLKLFPDAIRTASMHGIASYFMPFRSGDFALPIFLKTFYGIKLAEGSRILIKARLLDISVLGFFSLAAALLSYGQFPKYFQIIWIAAGTGMMLCFFIVRKFGFFLSSWFFKKSDLLINMCKVDLVDKSEIAETFMIWLFIGLSFYSVARAIELNLTVNEVCLLVTIQLPLQLAPVQGFANAGNHEGGWVAGLMLMGVDAKTAIGFAIASHALLILYVLALGIPALFFSHHSIYNQNTS